MEMKLLNNLLCMTGTGNFKMTRNRQKKSGVAGQQHQGIIKMAKVHTVLTSDQSVMIEQIEKETGMYTD
jgi:hypothetical protein